MPTGGDARDPGLYAGEATPPTGMFTGELMLFECIAEPIGGDAILGLEMPPITGEPIL